MEIHDLATMSYMASSQPSFVDSCTPVLQNMTVFGDRAFEQVPKVNEVIWVGCNPAWIWLSKKTNQEADKLEYTGNLTYRQLSPEEVPLKSQCFP